jgi:hypothetical protein
MPREAKLFLSSAGSAARGFLRFRANIPPRWIKNAHKSRKRIEPEIVDALGLSEDHPEKSSASASRPKECEQAIQGGFERLGDSLQQREFLPRDTYSSRATATGLFEVVTVPIISGVY